MKKIKFTLVSSLICTIILAQTVPQGINYQAIARDANGDVLMNQTLTIQFSVISDITTSAVSWQETHTVTTNDYGLFTAIIGQGATTSAGSSATFDVIEWGVYNHSLKVEIDYGNGYIDMGTTDFMSVPYSLHAKTAANVSTTDELQTLFISGDTLFISNGNYIILPTVNTSNTDECFVAGCTDSTACNYDASACYNDGSCILPDGCTDPNACNYDASATCDDGSCYGYFGCMDSTACNYDASATCDDGSCNTVYGCTDPNACNYDASATCDDGSCYGYFGCTDPLAFNYDPAATCDDGSCTGICIGCTYEGGIIFYLDGNGGGLIASNSDFTAEWGCVGTNINGADGTAIGAGLQNTIDIEAGCSTTGIAADLCANLTLNGYSDWFLPSKDEFEELYNNIGPGDNLGLGNIANISTSSSANYWSSSEVDENFAWRIFPLNGIWAYNMNKSQEFYVRPIRVFGCISYGCTDSTACNYDASATCDDFSCFGLSGCTDPTACNYDASATCDDGSCFGLSGCTDPTACNYNAYATCDDGSCLTNYGCTDPTALNYDASATCDDGSCVSQIGDFYQGGYIFYLDGNGGGLIVAPSDQDTDAEWGCRGTNIAGADGDSIGDGAQNTTDIVNANCSPHSSGNAIAAYVCSNLTLGGYSDWFLPSILELEQIYNTVGPASSNTANITIDKYWSSTETDTHYAKRFNMDNGDKSAKDKFKKFYVRAIRAF